MTQETAGPRVVGRAEWLEARLEHLRREKELTRSRDALSRERRRLPWLEITEDYRFTGPGGEQSLADLFAGRSQLLVYHFMLGPGWVEGCPSCSFWADNFEGIGEHLAHRDTTLVAVSRAPLAEIEAYRARMGWTSFNWLSSAGSDFNFDFAVSFDEETIDSGRPNYNFGTQVFGGEEAAGISAFRKDGGRVYLTYQTFSRGLDMVNGAYHWLDLTSKGRDEDDLEYTMAWLHRHNAYPD